MKHADLRSDEDLTRETMHIACIYGWLSRGWDQQRYGCQIDKSPFPDSSDLVADQMEAARIYHAMTKQVEPVNHWLFLAYGDEHATDWMWRARKVGYELWLRMFPERRDETNYQLVWMALQDFRKRVLGQPATSEEVLIAGMGAKKWAWRKLWKPRFDDTLDQLQTWDVHGVAMVSITIREIREGRS